MHILLEGRQVDLVSRLVQCDDGRTLTLTALEARLLGFLAQREGQTVPREDLLTQVWGYRADVVTRCVDSAVRRLRTKLENKPSEPRHILKVHGYGYRLDLIGSPPPTAPPVETDVTSAGLRLFGRAAVLERIGRALDAGYRTLLIRGLPGIGRSALLDEVALRFGGRFPGGAWRTGPADDRKKLIILDEPDEVPTDPTATYVIATNGPGEGFEVTLAPLGQADAVAMLRHRSGLADVEAVVDRLGGHPGALVEAARALAVHEPESVAREGLALLPQTRRALSAALKRLDGREVLETLAAFPDGFSREDAESVGAATLPADLARFGWIDTLDGGYRLPRVVSELLEAPLDARERFRALVLERGEAAGEEIAFWPDVDSALEDAHQRGDVVYVMTLLGSVGPQAKRAGRWDWMQSWYRRIGEGEYEVSPQVACRWLRLCGELDRVKTRLDLSRERFERAHQIAVATGDAPEIAMCTGCLAILAHTEYRHREAEALYREAADLCEAEGLDHYRQIFMGNLGRLYSSDGRVIEAEPLLREVFVWRLKSRNEVHIERSRMDLAWCLSQLGHYGEALEHLREVGANDRGVYSAEVARLRGLMAAEGDDLRDARKWFATGIESAERLQKDRTLAIQTGHMAVVEWWSGDRAAARSGLQRCIELHQRTEQPGLAIVALIWLSALEGCEGRHGESAAIRRRATEALAAHHSPWPLAHAVAEIGDALVALSEGNTAPATAVLQSESGLAASSLELRVARRFLGSKSGRR